MSTATAGGAQSQWQPVRRVGPRIHTGELVSTVSGLLLAPVMFLLGWFGRVGPSGAARGGATLTENAWNGMTVLRWMMLVTLLLAVGATVLHASQRPRGVRTDTGVVIAAAGTLTAVLVGFRVLVAPPDASSVVDTKLGAYLGVLALTAIALGGLQSIREDRERRPGSVSASAATGWSGFRRRRAVG